MTSQSSLVLSISDLIVLIILIIVLFKMSFLMFCYKQ